MRYNKINLFFHKNLVPTGFCDIFKRIFIALNKFSYDQLRDTILPGCTMKRKVISMNPKPIIDKANYIVKKMILSHSLKEYKDISINDRKRILEDTVKKIDPHFVVNPDYTMLMIEQTLHNQDLRENLLTEYNKLYQQPFDHINRKYYTDGNLNFGFLNKELCFWHKDLLKKQSSDFCYHIVLAENIYIAKMDFHHVFYINDISKEDYDAILGNLSSSGV